MARGWIEAVAGRAEVSVELADEALKKRGISPQRRLGAARRLGIDRVQFSGRKSGLSAGEFSFDWSIGPGVWALASYDNLVGKSSVLEIILWALRGEPKGLQDDVRSWLESVKVSFAVDQRKFELELEVQTGIRGGLYEVASGRQVIEEFDSEAGFTSFMSEFMMEALSLEPIPAFQAADGDGRQISHGWAALSGALYIGGDHKILIGDVSWSGLPGRMLQVYVGLPWASTLMQARTARKVVAQEGTRGRRAAEAIAAREDLAAERIRADLEKAQSELLTLRTEVNAAQIAADLAQQIPLLLSRLGDAEVELRRLKDHELLLTDVADNDERSVIDLREDQTAALFFNGLRPEHCPRCEGSISQDRLDMERKDKHCSVCARPVPSSETDTGDLAEAEDRSQASLYALRELQAELTRAIEVRDAISGELETARQSANSLRGYMNLRRSRQLELQIARLQGELSGKTTSDNTPLDDGLESRVIEAAGNEARERVMGAQQQLLAQLDAEITRLAQRFGMLSLESVEVDALARMKVRKGGQETTFSKLTTGERLRLRVATALALLRVARQFGVGRHPGLLIIDSPASEETTDQNLETLLRELGAVADDNPELQVIIATARAADVKGTVQPTHIRLAEPKGYLW
jgi:hypothetical protein